MPVPLRSFERREHLVLVADAVRAAESFDLLGVDREYRLVRERARLRRHGERLLGERPEDGVVFRHELLVHGERLGRVWGVWHHTEVAHSVLDSLQLMTRCHGQASHSFVGKRRYGRGTASAGLADEEGHPDLRDADLQPTMQYV